MSVNPLIFLPAIFLTNKKDDEDMLSPSLCLSFNLPAPFWVNIKFRIFILAIPKSRYKKRFYNKCWGPPRLQHLFFSIKNALISFFLYNKVTTLNRKGEISAKLY